MMHARIESVIISGGIILELVLTGCSQKPPGPVSANSGGDWNVTIWESSPCVQPNDIVHLRASVTNNRGTQEVIDSKDRPVLDIEISLNKSKVRWSNGKPLTPDLTYLELKPGETKTIEMDWVANSDTGFHGAAAVFFYRDRPGYDVRPSVPLNIGYCTGG